jgi:hypothetical protein
MSSVFEIVTYTVTNIDDAERGRIRARKAVSAYAGFVAWTSFTAVEGQKRFIDLVEWDCLVSARAAQKRFLRDPEMREFIAAFGETLAMTHAQSAEST